MCFQHLTKLSCSMLIQLLLSFYLLPVKAETSESTPTLIQTIPDQKKNILVDSDVLLSPIVENKPSWEQLWKPIKPGLVLYLSYEFGEANKQKYNDFRITRGYVNLLYKLTKWFQSRVTFDTHQDDSNDWKVRLKYMFGKFIVPIETAIVTEPAIEFGLVHGPWFDFEEDINHYRMQGTMFIERNGVLNSADTGFTMTTLFGRKLPEDYQKRVSDRYPGQWGSMAVGMYNGSGYHGREENENKVVESRISIRPLKYFLPNLQLSHFFIMGKGNTPRRICNDTGMCQQGQPDWLLNAFMASFEHEYFTSTFQFANGKGNQKGDQVNHQGHARDAVGYSGFLEIKLPIIQSSLMGRYDWWQWDNVATARIVSGFAYYLYKYNIILLNIDYLMHNNRPNDYKVSAVLQVHY